MAFALLGRGPHNPAVLACHSLPKPVQGAVDTPPTTVQHVHVNHRRLDVLVPRHLPDCPDDRHSRVELFTTPSPSEILALATGYGN